MQEQQLGPGTHVEKASNLEEKHEQLRHRDLFRSAVMDRLANGADRLRKAGDGMVGRHVPSFKMHFRRPIVVAGDEAEQNLRQETAFLRGKPTHDAEVHGDELTRIVNEQVSGMHVGVEEAVAQGMAEECLDHGAGQPLEIEALGRQPRVVPKRDAFNPFERKHVACGSVPIDGGHAEIRIIPGIFGHLRKRCRLEPQIHFEGHGAS